MSKRDQATAPLICKRCHCEILPHEEPENGRHFACAGVSGVGAPLDDPPPRWDLRLTLEYEGPCGRGNFDGGWQIVAIADGKRVMHSRETYATEAEAQAIVDAMRASAPKDES